MFNNKDKIKEESKPDELDDLYIHCREEKRRAKRQESLISGTEIILIGLFIILIAITLHCITAH